MITRLLGWVVKAVVSQVPIARQSGRLGANSRRHGGHRGRGRVSLVRVVMGLGVVSYRIAVFHPNNALREVYIVVNTERISVTYGSVDIQPLYHSTFDFGDFGVEVQVLYGGRQNELLLRPYCSSAIDSNIGKRECEVIR